MLADTKPAILSFLLSFLLPVFTSSLSNASDRTHQPSGTSVQAEFSADDFDWREMLPSLFEAATLPGEQGIKKVLENSTVLRVYVRNEVRAECRVDKNPCTVNSDGSMLEGEVSRRIDKIIGEWIFRRHKTAIVDYTLARQPFPFSEIAAVKSEKRPDAYFMLALADGSYTAAQVQANYGAPYDTSISQWYSVFKYRVDSPQYTGKAVFEVDPVDGAVIKIAISLKPKKPKNRH